MDKPKPKYHGTSYKEVYRGSLFGTRGFIDDIICKALSQNALTPASKARRAAQIHRAFGNQMNRRAEGLAQLAIGYEGARTGDTYEVVRERLRQAWEHYEQEIVETVRAGILGYLESSRYSS